MLNDTFVSNYQWYRTPAIATAILVVVFASSYWLMQKRFADSDLVQATREVQLTVRNVLSSLQDAETGVRGYALTNDEAFLDPFRSGKMNSLLELSKLETMTADNAKHRETLSALRGDVDQLLINLANKVNDVKAGRLDRNLIYVGKRLMDQVRRHVSNVGAVEAELLEQRLQQRQNTTLQLMIALSLGTLASLAGITAWVFRARADYNTIASANERLATTLNENAAASEQIRQMQKMEAVGQLTGGIAHDFNNMLAITIGALDLVKKRLAKGNTNITELLDSAYDGANRASVLTKRLLDFSRQQTLSPKLLQANTVVQSMHDLISRAVGETISTETTLGAGVWPIEIDKSALENALLNLCVNARDAMPEGGKITIETANFAIDDVYARQHYEVQPGQYVMIAVTDTGSGMTDDVIAKAFDPFFTTKGVGKGTGLGLSQVHGFVKQSNGHIKIYSEVGQGTTVKLYFPRTYDVKSSPVENHQPLARGAASELVLVVEDDARVRDVTVSMVRELGYSVIHAPNATEALVEIKNNKAITLLFTDIVMPGINGRQLADQAKLLNPSLRVLFTTGYSRNAIVHNGVLDAGVLLLPKPFTLDALSHKLREVLESAS